MADGDEQFRVGVEHGYNDEPCYRWQDRFHQERYEAGYLLGRWQRTVADADGYQRHLHAHGEEMRAVVEAMRKRRGGYERDR